MLAELKSVAGVGTGSVGILSTHLADGISIRVSFIVNLMRRVANVLLIMLGPIQVFVPQLRWSFNITADEDAINHRSNKSGEPKDQEDNSENPHKQRFNKLDDDDESQRDENQPQVDEKHQTTNASDVGAERVRS